mmetsp:Transcript_12566/g.27117  ORF Transcript_12566/g.27117 Transcript_12566/m.27117 type:complete len:353 (+) Transcript_12566:995-2053(+)
MAHAALLVQLAQPPRHQPHGLDGCQHACHALLHQLEGAKGGAKLLPLLHIARHHVIHAYSGAHWLPGHHDPADGEHLVGVLEGVHTWQAGAVRHKAALKGHVGVLHTAQRNLVLNLLRPEARGSLANDEGVDLVGFGVPGPYHNDLSPGAVTDPALLAIQNPATWHLGGCAHEGGGIGAVGGLREGPAPRILKLGHFGQQLLLLLLRAQQADGEHGQVGVHQQEGGHAAVHTGNLHHRHGVGHHGHIRAAIPPDTASRQIELGKALHQLKGELGLLPVLGDDGGHIGDHVLADPVSHSTLLRRQQAIQIQGIVHGIREGSCSLGLWKVGVVPKSSGCRVASYTRTLTSGTQV